MAYLNRPLMRYKFNIRFKTYNNEFHDFPVIICALDDFTAYQLALNSFMDHIKYQENSLHIAFTATEKLTIIMRKELS